MDHIIAIDGGGTSCRALVADGRGAVLGRGRAGSANIMTDLEGARKNIAAAAEAACVDAGLPADVLSSSGALLGLAGANIGNYGERIRAILPFRRSIVETDALIALNGALGDHDGTVAILGTGSAYMVRHDGRSRAIGGWGFQVGDQGSGARIGRDLLEQTLLAHDGRLSLDEPVARHAPSLKLPGGNEQVATVANLLSHTLGLFAHAEDPKLEDGEAIVAAARRAGIKLGVGYLLRFDPRYYHARELLRSGRIGAPIHIYARRNSARTEGPKRYGGTLPLALHVTVHDVDLVLWMLEGQQPISVYAQQTDRLLGATGTQDTLAAVVRFSGGTLVNFESAWVLPAGAMHMIDARLELMGTEGSFEVQCGDSGLYFADAQGAKQIDTQHWPAFGTGIGGDLRLQLSSMLATIDGRPDALPPATGEEALRSLVLTRAIINSAESGDVIKLQGPAPSRSQAPA